MIEAGQRTVDNTQFLKGTGFKLQQLHVVYRSARHISEITHKFIDILFPVNLQSSKVRGCFESSQNAIEVQPFESIKKLTIQSMANLLKNFKPSKPSDQIVILFTDKNPRKQPLNEIEGYCQERGGLRFFKSVVGLWDESQKSFTGIEAKSVIIIIDLEVMYTRSLYLINLAVTRAQYGVGVFIKKKLEKNPVWCDYVKGEKPRRLKA